MNVIERIFTLAVQIPIGILAGVGAVFVCAFTGFFLFLHLNKRLNPYRRALRFYEKGHLSKALVFTALELDRNHGNKKALELKADIEVQRHLDEDALNDYYRLIGFKRPGDGIDVLEIKRKMLLPLHRCARLFELFTVCSEILKSDKNNPDALYYMAVLYTGQMYFREAARLLEKLVVRHPHMAEARFLYCVVLCQERDFSKALSEIIQARRVRDEDLYRIIHASVLYFTGDFTKAIAILKRVSLQHSFMNSPKKSYFVRRLNGFCQYRTGAYEQAVSIFRSLYNETKRWRKNTTNGMSRSSDAQSVSTYDETGRVKKQDKGAQAVEDTEAVTDLGDYYRLKEVALEERKLGMLKTPPSLNRLLDIEGLGYETQAALDYVFGLMRSGHYSEAVELLRRIRKDHPEVIGLNRLLSQVAREGRFEGAVDDRAAGDTRARVPYDNQNEPSSGVSKKMKLFSLSRYMEEWEQNAIKPYQMIIISGLAARKQLSPLLLFGGNKK